MKTQTKKTPTEEIQWPPLGWMAERMGYSNSGISRLRSGNRKPNIDTVLMVEDTLGWSATDQIKSIKSGEWLAKFAKVVIRAHRADMLAIRRAVKNEGASK